MGAGLPIRKRKYCVYKRSSAEQSYGVARLTGEDKIETKFVRFSEVEHINLDHYMQRLAESGHWFMPMSDYDGRSVAGVGTPRR